MRSSAGPLTSWGCTDGAIVALLVALHRPDLIGKLVFIAGVFHRDGWAPVVVDPDNTPPEFLERLYGELSPDGPQHYPVVVAKLAKMHVEGPTLTVADLNRIASRTLVMIGDDDEVSSNMRSSSTAACPTPSSRSSPELRMGCSSRSRRSATR